MAEHFYAEFQDEEVQKFLRDFDKKIKIVNGKDASKKYIGLLSAIVYKDVVTHFDEEKGPTGPWKQWSTFYKAKMDEEGKGGNKILQDTGRLRNNFKPQKVKKVSAGFMWFNDAQTKKGFPYAYAHETGGPQLPKRSFMWLSDNAMEQVETQTLKFILDEGI